MLAESGTKAVTLSSWYSQLPLGTRLLLTTTIAVHAMSIFIPPDTFCLSWRLWEIWRPVTSAFATQKLSLGSLFHIVMLHRFSLQMETSVVTAPLQFLYVVVVVMGAVTVMCGAMGQSFTSPALPTALLFIWCRTQPSTLMTIPFVNVKIRALYYPLAFLGILFLFGSAIVPEIAGILGGHLFVYCTVLRPQFAWVFAVPPCIPRALDRLAQRRLQGKVLPW